MKTHSILLMLLVFSLLPGARVARAASQPNAWQIADSSGAAGFLYFTNTLTSQQKIDATNHGWRFTVVSRLVAGSPNVNPGQFMIYGLGDRRFIVGWDTNAAGQFTARLTLTNGTTIFTNLTAPGEATNDYHRHELVYDPVTQLATYLFDGASIYTWPGVTNDANFNGQAAWGAASNGGRGRMNYHHVQFAIGGQIVSEYFAGSAGNPPIAPSPTNQGWTLTWTAPSTTLTNFAVSPDAAIVVVPPILVTQPATAITTTNAMLNATVTPGNFPSAYFFQYGLTTNYGSATPAINLPPGDSAIAVSNALTGLSPGTLYHFRIVATNSVGVTFGSDLTFTTEPASPVSFPISPAYTFSTVAGYGGVGGADGPGSLAQFNSPIDVALDTNGNVYVADLRNNTIRKITPAGLVSTIAGVAGNSGSQDGTNNAALFNGPVGITVDHLGRVFVADQGANTIRMLTPVGGDWVATTIAGRANSFESKDGTNGNSRVFYPFALTVDPTGNVYFTEASGTNYLRKITPVGTNWVVTTLPNSGLLNGTTNASRFVGIGRMVADADGNLYLTMGSQIRKATPNGNNVDVETVTAAGLFGVIGIALDAAGDLYLASQSQHRIQKLSQVGTNWVLSAFAGSTNGTSGTADGTGSDARFSAPYGVAVDGGGNVYVADRFNSLIRKITSAAVVSTLAGAASTGSTDGAGDSVRFGHPESVAVDNAGNVFVADTDNSTIRKITSAGVVSTIAGLAASSGTNDGAGSLARFASPSGVAVSQDGNVYVADTDNHTIRKVTPAGVVTTIAGQAGISGTADGTNRNAKFSGPHGLAAYGSDTLFVSDRSSDVIRKLVHIGSNWVVSTIAGSPGNSGSSNGVGSAARFSCPTGLAVDAAGNVFVADQCNYTIRKVSPLGTNWIVSTIAGTPGEIRTPGQAVEVDGTNGTAHFDGPRGLAVDGEGNVYAADSGYNRIRKLVPVGTNWVVTTIGGLARTLVGNLPAAGSADGAGSTARFSNPGGIAVDLNGTLFIADTDNSVIRKGGLTPFAPINQVSYATPPMNGRLTVTLTPTNASGQWRFPWELGWHNGGATVSNLVAGDYPIEFRNVPGWIVFPLGGPATLSSGAALSITNVYYPTLNLGEASSGSGSLTIFLGPTPPAGAGWRFLGESTAFFPNGFSTNLQPGVYLIEFAAVNGRVKPPSQAVQVNAGQPTFLSVNYLLAAAPPANVQLPFLVPANQVSDTTNYPFGFNGQLQSDTGYGSGVAVQANVVLTAAHLVFNDQTLSYVRHAYWFFRRNVGVSEPLPQEARGFYVLSGYAAQRTNDLFSGSAPEQSTASSRNLDVAALYFSEPVAGGGFGGYLPSDTTPNTWLNSAALKMLVGYPVDGSQFGTNLLAGKMYQTDPQPNTLTRATDPVANQQVYVAPWFLSYPGNSGGPLYVEFNDYYYPAAVYLGTLFNGSVPYASVVRAIDSNVVNLITRAATQGDSGTNFTGGGVITIVPSQSVNASHPGAVQFVITPPAAVRAGAGWRLQGDTPYSYATNYTRAIFSTNAFAVEFKAIPGWNLPTNQNVFVSPDQLSTYTAFYTATNPTLLNLRVGATNRIVMTGTTGTVYRLERKAALTNATWLTVSTNTIVSTNFNSVLTNPAPGFYRLLWLTNF